MSRKKIISHYKKFFNIEDFPLGSGDKSTIDWGVNLIEYFIKIELKKEKNKKQWK